MRFALSQVRHLRQVQLQISMVMQNVGTCTAGATVSTFDECELQNHMGLS